MNQIKVLFTKDRSQIRNNDIGDYFIDENNDWQFIIFDTGNQWFNLLIFQHELTEFMLTEKAGIPEPDISAFDAWHLDSKQNGYAGDHELSPYKKQHRFAENIERQLAHELNISWTEYELLIDSL